MFSLRLLVRCCPGFPSDLFGLRLSLPRSRPAQISGGTWDNTEIRKLYPENMATVR